MAKLQVSDWDVVAANNTDINSIPIDGAVTTPSQVDNIVREMMAQIKTFSTTVTLTVGVSVDNTIPRFDGVAGALQSSTAVIGDDGSLYITGTGDTNKLGFFRVLNPNGTSDQRYTSIVVGKAANSNESMHFGFYYDTTAADCGGYIVNYGDSELTGSIFIRKGGNVGIGTATPTRKLDVVGSVAGTSFFKGSAEFGNDVADQVITGGARITSLSLGTITTGTVTPDPGDRPMQHYTNGGAHTLAPGSNAGFYTLDITNNGSAGAITTSGWTKVAGSVFTTTNGHKFRCSCSVGDGGSLLSIQALQ